MLEGAVEAELELTLILCNYLHEVITALLGNYLILLHIPDGYIVDKS